MGQTLSICQKNGADWIQSLQTIQGKGTRRQCHFAESLLFWRGYWPWQKGDAEFALINAKVPLQSWCWGVVVFSVAALSPSWHLFGLFSECYWRATSIDLMSSMCNITHGVSYFITRSFCESRLINVFTVYVPTLTVFWIVPD